MSTIEMVAAAIWLPGPMVWAGAWIASRLSTGARAWVDRQLFGV